MYVEKSNNSKIKESVKNNLDWSKYIAFTTDGWTSLNNESFVPITVHSILETNFLLKLHLLECYNFENFYK